ncbi:PREDICTED: dehydrogenase/reductase SDR family member 11 [Corvus brachyrhynchos]|uniref:dehydrogenase/reductase SDR family member 11 n=1 Tax=Corvus brachyrhynchos TaxID=85066 RepID=UPI0008166E6B|nr:PREDICTED: dehydrogenase/reductase SDR family member 11 [Corvus brachyrhynchos]XP_041882353.1 dehydrogenase/reductase SDR family member 11 isoform X1 [Corvus kubaryi]
MIYRLCLGCRCAGWCWLLAAPKRPVVFQTRVPTAADVCPRSLPPPWDPSVSAALSLVLKLAAECQSAGYPGTLIPYKCDLSNEEEILSMFSAIKTLHQGVDVCINNAGLARPEPLLSGKTEGWRTMIDVNVMAVSICTREAYQSMKERNIDDGHIININSMNGHSVVPQSVVHFYSATKYAVTALTEGLRQELREAKTHIRATCISPGLVETGFAFKLHDNDPERAAATYESIRCLKAEDMANAVIYVLSAPPHVQIGDIQMRPTEQIS